MVCFWLLEYAISLVETLSASKPNTSLAGIFSQTKFLISYWEDSFSFLEKESYGTPLITE